MSPSVSANRRSKRRKSKRLKKKKKNGKKKRKSGNRLKLPTADHNVSQQSQHPDRADMLLLIHGYIHERESELSVAPMPSDVVMVVLRFMAYHQFTFTDELSTAFLVSPNKMDVTLLPGTFGTIRFGEFLQSIDQCIYRVTFSMPRFQAAFVGVGFVSREYGEWTHSNFNLCEAHSAYVYGNGFYRLSPEFQELNKQWGSTVSCPPFADSDVADGAFHVEVNTFTMTAYISCLDAAEQCILFTFKLHLPEEVAIVIDAGDESQPIKVARQSFVYYP